MAKFEMELSASNPAKASKLFNPKAKCFSLYKRKIDSVKSHYYAMRKRIRHEPCLSADFSYSIAPCSCNPVDGGGCACGDHHLLHKVDPPGAVVGGCGSKRKHVHSNGSGQYSFHAEHSNSDGSMVIDGNTNYESPHGYSDVDKLYGCDNMQKNSQTSGSNAISANNRSDLTDQFDYGDKGSKAPLGIHQDGVKLDRSSGNTTEGFLEPGAFKAINQKWCLREPSVLTWSKVLGVKSSDMLTDMHKIGETLTLSDDKKMETNSIDALEFQANLDSVVCDSRLGSAMAPEGGFMHSYLKGLSQKEDLELLSSDFSKTDKEDLGPHPPDAINCDDHIDPIQKKPNVADVSGVDSIPASSEVLYPEHNVKCVLNKEDSEIPVNDYIPIPGQDAQHDARSVAKLLNMENGQPSSPPPSVNLESAILKQNANMVPLKEGCAVGSELPPGLQGNFGDNNANMCISALHSVDGGEETTCGFTKHESCYDVQNLTLDKSIQVSNQMNCKCLAHKPGIGCETAIQSCNLASALPDTEFHDPVATISTTGQAEGSDSEIIVPNYFDLEALILDLDLIPWDQESDFVQPEVSRFQYPESRKDLIRLEKGACSYMNRSIMSKGAFAILYGQRMKYYMREPEVSLGRETEEVHVDIDLSKEGKANKISRRQAVIKMDDDGSFYISNTGKYSIFVNGNEVPCSKRINLMSDSLIEIRNLKFIFHVNHEAARKYIVGKRRGSSQGENTAFDWSQNP
ncbi:hypothetical protein BDA96_02G065700 [Sorghum bicolor]|nr:uncharacterized protein LOC8075064 isoform X2 [Sorghum bicolor]KAG0542007.1 hypothetical protein BDA96_02G065700 [Sorghum bicolor]OQU88634.1 hypothetical protein SORBI_3002G064900 [Sorghum bicolor]OQU88635.1 hypothetical protein SORBI_3002G064900 [Sorghum bicolor]OQU88636.1 hypothetical protein SORBI_3002G064900 [Sorghum bicolor]|eukprot:XP_021307757.1 uncharacterized protein LOC8075064 isoform X2 [Sorghum bicolor]